MHGSPQLTPEISFAPMPRACFPWRSGATTGSCYWVSPERRGVIPLDGFHVPKRLARTVRSDRFTVTATSPSSTSCTPARRPRRAASESWINAEILRLYTALHASGHAHSLECWRDGQLVGGLYGVALGAAFFGESMFSRETDASKVALVHLVARLNAGGFGSSTRSS